MNNNNNDHHVEDVNQRRPRTTEDMFTASEFLNQHCPRQRQHRRESEPRIHRERFDYNGGRKVSTGNIEGEKPLGTPRGMLDLVIAVPLIPNARLEGPTLMAEEHKPIKKSRDGNTSALREHTSNSKSQGAYGDINIRPNLKYTMNTTIGGQRHVNWDLNTLPRDFICPITDKIMKQPVNGPDGVTYEKRAIYEWLERHNTSPVTKQNMSVDQLRSDGRLKARIREWKMQGKDQRRKLENTAAKSSDALLGYVQC